MDVISHPSFATLHAPESRGNDEHPGRLQALLGRFPDHVARRAGAEAHGSRLVHSAGYIDSIEAVSSEVWLDNGHVRHRDDLGGGVSCRRLRDRGSLSRRIRAGSAAWASRARVGCDGLLHLRERGHCRPLRASFRAKP